MSADTTPVNFVALIPAAGIGSRMGSDLPKQYLNCLDKPLICHALELFQAQEWITTIMVTLAESDNFWNQLCAGRYSKVVTTPGGASRAESVRNGLLALTEQNTGQETWVMVHDAARPCLSEYDLLKLKQAVLTQDDRTNYGVILADKIHDTVKKVDDSGRIVSTEDRQLLWRAQTPQVFELTALLSALNTQNLDTITDEASAMEQSDNQPEVIQGETSNIKVTTVTDLRRAELYLSQRET